MNTTKPIVTNGNRNSSEEELELRRGPWTLEEDTLLIRYIARHEEGRWNLLAKCAGLKRTGKSCRLRWLNYLKPDIKRGNLTLQEQLLILELHSRWGNRWSKIAQQLPGRTDNEIKNYWRTRVQKQARQLKIDSNSKRFLEAIRRFWMPRLLEKMEQTSALTTSLSSPASAVERAAQQHSNIASILPKQQDPLASASLQPSKQMDSPNHPNDNDNDNDKSGSVTSAFVCSSSDYMAFPQLVSEAHPFSAPADHAFANTNSIADDCYYMDIEGFNLPTTSATRTPDLSSSACQMEESHWTGDEVADSLWNTDELWQFRK